MYYCIYYIYRYATSKTRPPVDDQEDLTNAAAVHDSGVTTISFSRKVATGDSAGDFDLNQPLYWFFAYGAFSSPNPSSIQYHGVTRGFISTETISLPC